MADDSDEAARRERLRREEEEARARAEKSKSPYQRLAPDVADGFGVGAPEQDVPKPDLADYQHHAAADAQAKLNRVENERAEQTRKAEQQRDAKTAEHARARDDDVKREAEQTVAAERRYASMAQQAQAREAPDVSHTTARRPTPADLVRAASERAAQQKAVELSRGEARKSPAELVREARERGKEQSDRRQREANKDVSQENWDGLTASEKREVLKKHGRGGAGRE